MSNVKILIVENEVIISEDISMKLRKQGYEITSQVTNAPDALQSVRDQRPDLIIMDIDLDGKTDGIDTAVEINKEFNIPVIFLTDLDNQQTLQRAAKANPANYLVKPFNERQIHASIHQALHNASESKTAVPGQKEAPIEDHYVLHDCLFLRVDSNRFTKVLLKNILYLQAGGSYAHLFTAGGEKHTYTDSMNKIFDKMQLPSFLRVSRSHVVNLDQITDIKGQTLMIGDIEIPVGKSYKDDVMKRLPMLK